MDLQEKRQQVADQCRAIAHMANILSKVHSDYARLFQDGAGLEGLEDQVGERTAVLMNTFGDILNGIDAVEEADAWVNPIMERSREVFPERRCPACDKPIPHDEHVTVMGKRYHIPCQPPFPKQKDEPEMPLRVYRENARAKCLAMQKAGARLTFRGMRFIYRKARDGMVYCRRVDGRHVPL